MKVYLALKYRTEYNAEQATEFPHLCNVIAVTISCELAADIADANQYRTDPQKEAYIYKVEEFPVYGKLE